MQIKLIAATIAGFAVGSAIAGPLPVPVTDDALAVREADAVAAPIDDPIVARAEQAKRGKQVFGFPDAALLGQIHAQAAAFASAHVGTVATVTQIQLAQQWWPDQFWQNDWDNGDNWDWSLWYIFSLYQNWPQFNPFWNQNVWANGGAGFAGFGGGIGGGIDGGLGGFGGGLGVVGDGFGRGIGGGVGGW